MKNIFSNICIAIVCICSIAIIFNLKNWEKRDRVIEWDIHGYYGYLPAKFIFDDIKLEKSNYQFDSDYSLFWPIGVGDGKNAIHKTMGLSILYSPFFFSGHYVAKWLNFPLNGFSEPYKLFLLFKFNILFVSRIRNGKKNTTTFKFYRNPNRAYDTIPWSRNELTRLFFSICSNDAYL
ncbi:MAG: hypothetical protein IPP71_11160 [Bacteroidetes bacterium]|nr:hypothetical protein [Bacteroidota bacterium]